MAGIDFDFEAGCPCPCIECEERLVRRVHEDGPSGCSCHLSAPCSWHTDVTLYCRACGWEGDWSAFEEEWEGLSVPREPEPAPAIVAPPPPSVVVAAPAPAPVVVPTGPQFQRYRYIENYRDGYTAVVARAMTDWGQVIESTPWVIKDGSAEAELCEFVRNATSRRNAAMKAEKEKAEAERVALDARIAAYPTHGVMVSDAQR